ncbi:MAG: IS200/IS605 family transposase [Candidatus Sumerlaeota bacterium]|nr:IS200/IS605 family transposase [Candidatus Sumerlaeota bacterium]
MSTYTQIYYHITFSTKDREPLIRPERRDEFLRYVWGIIKNLNCHLYRINAVEDHLHIFTSLHPIVCLAHLVKTIKVSSTKWIKEGDVFPGFSYWQDGYGAFTHSTQERDMLIEYVKNQQEHHKTESYIDEFKRLLKEAGMEFEERFLE